MEYDAESLTNEMEFDVWTKIRLFVDQQYTHWSTCGHNELVFKSRGYNFNRFFSEFHVLNFNLIKKNHLDM